MGRIQTQRPHGFQAFSFEIRDLPFIHEGSVKFGT
jgi:hypothetical protein